MVDNTFEVTISCLCGQHQHTFALPTSTNSLSAGICHCTSCRKASGASLHQGSILWAYPLIRASETTQTPSDPKTLLQMYNFGPKLDYWYCTTCSTKMYWQYRRPNSGPELFPGLIPESLTRAGQLELSCGFQVHIADTLDEGLSSAFLTTDGSIAPRHLNDTDSVMYVAQELSRTAGDLSKPLEGNCHCGQNAVKLFSRPGHKFPVELDTSRESQLLNSVDVSVWVLVKSEDKYSINNMPLNILEALHSGSKDGKMGPLSTYTTDRTTIYFCNNCSATIFTRPLEATESSVARVGAGLLNSSRGVRADDYLDWSKVQPVEIASHNFRLDPKNFR